MVAICFGYPALIKNKIGLKNIPPPIPTIPEINPIIEPIKIETTFGIEFNLISSLLNETAENSSTVDFEKKEFISTFDTTIFGLTTIPILGWFKLLPTFGGRVITLASDLVLRNNLLDMNLQKTKVSKVDGLNKIPLFSELLMDRWYPVKEVWNKLPWNKESPNCQVSIVYLDEEMRIMQDMYGSIFIYIRPSISLLNSNKISND